MTTPIKPRYLTKTRFKLGMECPTKLFYTGKEKVYANQNLEDSFLASLAEGGFQVGELAKSYFPGGYEIETLDYDKALQETNNLLQNENVVIFEAAVRYEQFFIRADILVKKGTLLELIEVKAKSYDPEKDGDFLGARGGIRSSWEAYLFDVAFQKHVITKAFPQSTVRASLMLADKTTECPTNGLNQKFKVATGVDGRKGASLTTPLTAIELSKKILVRVPVDGLCKKIYDEPFEVTNGPANFPERIVWLADHYAKDQKIITPPTPACAGCEFQAAQEDVAEVRKDGFKECWAHAYGWGPKEFNTPNILNIWNFRGKAKLMGERRVLMTDVTKEDIKPKSDGAAGVSVSERQWLQVEKAQTNDPTVWFDKTGLKTEMKKWVFPLHFIDFETTRVAIPFNSGRHPYEAIAFQFSHHVVEEGGGVEHKGQFLNTKPGEFPNYEFVRALKNELEQDKGSIFRYATHENSTLTAIFKQLEADPAPPTDAKELKAFIKSITTSTSDSTEQWEGNRSMIDLWGMVKRFYYAPDTNGSNSIKKVLPAVLAHSKFLQQYYSKPVYGTVDGIPSKNFKEQVWIKFQDGQIVDPYKQLPKMFQDVSSKDFLKLDGLDDELREGGAAMTAYARLQFEDLSDPVRREIESALLRYCELDTLAMVMIYQAWVELTGKRQQ